MGVYGKFVGLDRLCEFGEDFVGGFYWLFGYEGKGGIVYWSD